MVNKSLVHKGFTVNRETLVILRNYNTTHGEPGLSGSLRAVVSEYARMTGQSVIVAPDPEEVIEESKVVLGEGIKDADPF